MDHYPLNTKFLKKKNFYPKTLINFRNSLKISLSQDPGCSDNKQRNLPRTQCASPSPIPPMANRVKAIFHFVLCDFNPLSAKPTKWSNTFKQFVGKLPTNYLSVFHHFVKLALKGLTISEKNKMMAN